MKSEENAGPSSQMIAFGVPYSHMILKNMASVIVPAFWSTKGNAFVVLCPCVFNCQSQKLK